MPLITRRAALTLTAAAAMAPGAGLAAGRWRAAPSVPWAVQEVYGVAWRGQVLIAGGMAPGGGQTNALDRTALYDPRIDRWSEAGRLPFPRHHPALAACYSERYAAAGYPDAFAIGGFRITEAGAWTAIKEVVRFDLFWTAVEPMPQFQCETVALGLQDRIHVVTGRAPRGEKNAAYADHMDVAAHQVFLPDLNIWTTARPAPLARNSATGGVIDDKLYVAGGRTMGGGNSGQLDRYDPQSDSWTSLRPMPQGAGGLAGAVVGGKLYVFGGEGGPRDNGYGGVIPQCWSYDPKTDQWTAEAAMGAPRHGLAAVAVDGRIYAVGGGLKPSGAQVCDLMEAFTPA